MAKDKNDNGSNKEIRLNIRLTEKTRDEFRTICDRHAINASAMIRQWIDEFIADNKTKVMHIDESKIKS